METSHVGCPATRRPGRLTRQAVSYAFVFPQNDNLQVKRRSSSRTLATALANELLPPDTLDMHSSKLAMRCTELAQQIEKIQPNATPQDVARLCLLLTNEVDNLEALRERTALHDAWKQMGLQLQLATDQHAAMTQELEDLAASDPNSFTQDQIWILIRAIKVQSQVLQMYVGHPWLDV
jgi:hypothetical protein